MLAGVFVCSSWLLLIAICCFQWNFSVRLCCPQRLVVRYVTCVIAICSNQWYEILYSHHECCCCCYCFCCHSYCEGAEFISVLASVNINEVVEINNRETTSKISIRLLVCVRSCMCAIGVIQSKHGFGSSKQVPKMSIRLIVLMRSCMCAICVIQSSYMRLGLEVVIMLSYPVEISIIAINCWDVFVSSLQTRYLKLFYQVLCFCFCFCFCS